MESRHYSAVAVLLVLGLIASAFVVPTVYTWSEVCPTCSGVGRHSCFECYGSGVCSFCGGDGKVLDTPKVWWCAACSGTGNCYRCDGTGVVTCETCYGRGSVGYWRYNLFGSSVLLSVFDAFLFVGLFVLNYIFEEFYLGFNEWVYDVKSMGFWFNRSFSIWLFATDRKRWAKWSSGFCAFGAFYIGALTFWLFSAYNVTVNGLIGGILVSVFATSLFAWLFYKYYTSRKPALHYEPM